MNDLTPVPRHRQTQISFRSDRAAELLALLTRTGRSQAQVIEEALEKAAAEDPPLSLEEKIARLDVILRPLRDEPKTTYRELREAYYDENGLPR